jgi:polyisoprenoid-binding protein YceI
VGKTGDVKGFVTFDPDDLSASVRAAFEVDLASLDTGIGMRDEHMREQYLETAKYPKAVFELTGIDKTDTKALVDGSISEVTARGNFTVHGVTREIAIPITLKYMKQSEQTQTRLPGDLLQITAEFDILLTDYNIKRPQFVILKLDDKQKINIDLFASTGLPAAAISE